MCFCYMWRKKLVLFHPRTLSHCGFFWNLVCQMSRKFAREMVQFCVTNCSATLFMNFCQMSGRFLVEKLLVKTCLQKQYLENWSRALWWVCWRCDSCCQLKGPFVVTCWCFTDRNIRTTQNMYLLFTWQKSRKYKTWESFAILPEFLLEL